ncbi:topoisomerase C-terminal repeat-containing protein [Flavonifractor plautii]|uniref:topoisomerase C-terminal repeat-containing protein n=1 Tax=Flavonifractor plautii TaxID=292800 RepID=UPI001D003B54|nr:topoisomerase C-terminal repeat-containing protein [Flavonifractor plautii]MCB5855941.1 topoisomerase C-terminal repeat-containing protein [Flavonifractor plautii]
MISYWRMVEDGICEIEPGLFSRTIRFSDINYQTARRDDQIDIFSRYCEFLNWLSSSIHLQINLINRRIDKDSFKEQMFLKYQGERLDEYRKEINTMLSEKALEGQNSILREKYMTVTTAASSYETSIPALARLETDSLGLCPICGRQVRAYPKSYSCESGKGGCGFTIWKSIAQKSITEAQVKKLLATGRSSLIKGFVSKAGKNFDAYLILKDDHQVGFEFPSRGERKV